MTNQPPLAPCCGGGGGGGGDDTTTSIKPNRTPRRNGEPRKNKIRNNPSVHGTTTTNTNTKRKKCRLDKKRDHVMIVGSGLAGLSCALSLEQAGYQNISLFERDVDFDAQKEGYGLTISYNPKGALAKLGLLEQVAQSDCPSRSHYIFEVRIQFPLFFRWMLCLCIFCLVCGGGCRTKTRRNILELNIVFTRRNSWLGG
jgi:hypothetical protein